MRRVCLAGVVLLLGGLIVAPLAQTHAPAVPPLAATLRETGLYSDWDTKTVAPGHLRYAPQYPLWTDGAAKSRWLHLPADSWIDASNPDAWEFPVGTKVWKEFRFHGAPAETRMIERTTEGWRYASYAWRPDGSATLVSERGILNSVEIADGVRHAIPSRTDCTACHEAGPSRLLSVSALQLSSDRDPLAPHAEPLPEGAVTLQTLVDRGLVRNLPMQLARSAPRIAAASPVERAALGYLHGNCGMCHTGAGEMASLGFVLQYPLAQGGGRLGARAGDLAGPAKSFPGCGPSRPARPYRAWQSRREHAAGPHGLASSRTPDAPARQPHRRRGGGGPSAAVDRRGHGLIPTHARIRALTTGGFMRFPSTRPSSVLGASLLALGVLLCVYNKMY